MNLRQVVHAGEAGFVYTAISISGVMVLGWLFGRILRVSKKASLLDNGRNCHLWRKCDCCYRAHYRPE